jgi:hypothetical protein
VYPYIYLYEDEDSLASCIKYMQNFTGVKVKDLKRRSFKVSICICFGHYACFFNFRICSDISACVEKFIFLEHIHQVK